MKKLLLSFGSLVASVAPVTAIISCGCGNTNDDKKVAYAKKAIKFDFTADLDKFVDSPSTKDKDALKATVGSLTKDEEVDADKLGITAPTLSQGVTATYKIQTAYNANNGQVVVAVTLAKAGEKSKPKNITITAKDFDFSDDLDKFDNVISTKERDALSTAVSSKSTGDDVTAAELGITTSTLSPGVTATYKIQTAYNASDGQVVVTVTLAKSGETPVTKNITITAKDFDFTADLAEFTDARSARERDYLSKAVSSKSIGEDVTKTELGFTEPTLSQGVTATYKIQTAYNANNGQVVVAVTLAKAGEKSKPKNITITAKPINFTTNLAEIVDEISSKDKAALQFALSSKHTGDYVTAADLGITTPTLSTGVTATYKIQTAYNANNGQVVVAVTLAKLGEKSQPKNITITAEDPDLRLDLPQFKDATSTKDRDALKNAVGSKSTGDYVTEAELGITEPSFTYQGVTATYKIQTAYNANNGQVVVTVTLAKSGETPVSKNITITAKDFDFSDYFAEIGDALLSTKNKDALNTAVGSKSTGDAVTAADLGITTPILSTGVTATYKIQTPYNANNGQVVVAVTWAKAGEKSQPQDITISAS